MTSPDLLTVIVPAYNEEPLLATALADLERELAASGQPHEIVLVDDASRDRTGQIADELAATRPHLRVAHHAVNGGIGAGIRTGIAEARGELLIVSPVDSPLTAAQVRDYVAAADGCDVVVGRRERRVGYTWWMRLGAKVYPAMLRALFRVPLHDFNWIHLYRRRVFDRVTIEYGGIVFLAEVLIKAHDAGFTLREIPTTMQARTSGRPTVSRPRVIWRTFLGALRLWWQLRGPGRGESRKSEVGSRK
ncbi:MAG TPA: glycosyltransferase family 2 protein [Thermomicrobiales bacterium]|nr:glycosyltransferase family 2 protein [Thermomicrobiales bacterium]